MSTTTSQLTDEQIAEYRKNGFIGVNDVFSTEEVEELRKVTDDYVEQSAELTDHTDVFDLDFAAGHSPETPKLRRIKEPHSRHPVYEAAMRKEGLLDIIEQLLGPNIKLHHTKLNMKAPGGGAQVEWHTDWGFYPASNDDILEIGLTFDDMEIENGCLMCIPGSHKGPALSHHQDGYFIGAVSENEFDMEEAVPIRINAGGVSIHHVRALARFGPEHLGSSSTTPIDGLPSRRCLAPQRRFGLGCLDRRHAQRRGDQRPAARAGSSYDAIPETPRTFGLDLRTARTAKYVPLRNRT